MAISVAENCNLHHPYNFFFRSLLTEYCKTNGRMSDALFGISVALKLSLVTYVLFQSAYAAKAPISTEGTGIMRH